MTARQQDIIAAATKAAQNAPAATNDIDRHTLSCQAVIVYDQNAEQNITAREATLFQTTFCAAHVRIIANRQIDAAKADYTDARAFLERHIAAIEAPRQDGEDSDFAVRLEYRICHFVTAAKDFLANH